MHFTTLEIETKRADLSGPRQLRGLGRHVLHRVEEVKTTFPADDDHAHAGPCAWQLSLQHNEAAIHYFYL